MARIFISYRRADSETITGRIYERLVQAFGRRQVFRDLYTIPPGTNFRRTMTAAASSCEVMLVIIGPHWANITDSRGHKRLFDEDDPVRVEVETGLRNPNVTVVPVRVKNASMPAKADLPATLQELPDLNALMVRDDPDFDRDMGELINFIRGSLTRFPFADRRLLKRIVWAIGLIASLLAIFTFLTGIFTLGDVLNGKDSENDPVAVGAIDAPTESTAIIEDSTPLPPPTFTAEPTDTTEPTVAPSSTATRMPTITSSPTETATPTITPSLTETATPTATLTATPTTRPTDTPTNTPTPTPIAVECGFQGEGEFSGQGEAKVYLIEMDVDEVLNVAGEAKGDYLEFSIAVYSPGDRVLAYAQRSEAPVLQTARLSERGEYRIELHAPDVAAGFYSIYMGCIRNSGLVVDPGGYVDLTSTPSPMYTPAEATSTVTTGPNDSIETPQQPTPYPTSTNTPFLVSGTYPCSGTITTTSSRSLFVVYSRPNNRLSPIDSVMPGAQVMVLDDTTESGRIWYQIEYGDDSSVGWVWDLYVTVSNECPK